MMIVVDVQVEAMEDEFFPSFLDMPMIPMKYETNNKRKD